MPVITTENGQKIKVWLVHTTEQKEHNQERRVTKAFVTLNVDKKEPDFSTETVCNPLDQFDRFQGRSRASRRIINLLRQQTNWITKNDRKNIMAKLCPEFFITTEQREKMEFERLTKKFKVKEKKAELK